MLLCKGTNVVFKMQEGGSHHAAAMLHDESGRAWSKNSLLCATFRKSSDEPTDAQYKGAAAAYFGDKYNARVGSVDIPPKELSAWEKLGEVKEILYTRRGKNAGRFFHKFNSPKGVYRVIFAAKGNGKAILYRRGSSYRLELGKGSIADDRGIVFP